MGVALELGSRQLLERHRRNCLRSLQSPEGSDSRVLEAFVWDVGEA